MRATITNVAGQVESLTSNKQGRQSVIVDRIGYDKEGHTVYTKLGNGTETTYTYDKLRERLQVMNLTANGQTVMENRYRYDAVDNILGITNAANPTSLTKLNRAKLGGKSMHTYEYNELNRLVHANGKAKRASYDMVMSFGRMSEPSLRYRRWIQRQLPSLITSLISMRTVTIRRLQRRLVTTITRMMPTAIQRW